MSGDLRALAERYVTLTGEVEAVRRAMLACLTNGAGEHPARPTHPARSAGGSHPNAIAAQQVEERIIELLCSTAGLKTTEIAAQTSAKVNTTTQRLQRMKEKGQIERLDGKEGGWQAAAVPA
jgi:hypothetical protein